MTASRPIFQEGIQQINSLCWKNIAAPLLTFCFKGGSSARLRVYDWKIRFRTQTARYTSENTHQTTPIHEFSPRLPRKKFFFWIFFSRTKSHEKFMNKNHTRPRPQNEQITAKSSTNTHFWAISPGDLYLPCSIKFYRPIRGGPHSSSNWQGMKKISTFFANFLISIAFSKGKSGGEAWKV